MADRQTDRRKLGPRERVLLLATVPLLLALGTLALLITRDMREMTRHQITTLDAQLVAARREDLRRLTGLARQAIDPILTADPAGAAPAKAQAIAILTAMSAGTDSGLFVLDRDGQSLLGTLPGSMAGATADAARPAQAAGIAGKLIDLARQGGGAHSFDWPDPVTGRDRRVMAHVVAVQDWGWAIGTGALVDEVLATGAAARAEAETRVSSSLRRLGGTTAALILGVFLAGLLLHLSERRLADRKLKALTQRIFDTQEEERGRVARELHDSISQILVGVRYTLELARRRFSTNDARAGESLDQGIDTLNSAIHEVRRISRDLRPGLLDDLGLGPALQSLAEDFGRRTGISVDYATNPFRNRLDPEAKTALYRIAQEALTNIERHSGATHVKILVRGTSEGAVVRIEDNGHGMPATRRDGLGLRNMAERMAQLDGRLRVVSTRNGTLIEAQVPLTHMLPPTGIAEAQA